MAENDFGEHRLKILGDIARQNESLIKLQDIVTTLTIKMGQIESAEKSRAVTYGGISGFLAAAALVALAVVLEKLFP